MKKFKILALVLVALMVLSLALVACNPTNDNNGDGNGTGNGTGDGGARTKYTLTVWGSQEDQAMLKEMCAAYAAANPQNEYKFLFGVQSEADAADKVLNDVTSGPDVYAFASDQINKLYAGGALARIGGEIEKNVKEINSAGSIDAATLTIGGQDQLYAYPMTGDNCYFVYYDKRVYSDPSQLATLDSMLDVAESAGKKVHFKLNDDGWYLSSFFFANPSLGYEVTYNDKMVQTGVTCNYNNADGLKVMQALRTYVNHNALVIQTDDSKIIAGFKADENGKTEIAAAISGTWNAATIRDEELLGENMGVIKLPKATIGGQQVQLSGYMGFKLIGVNGFSKNKGEAHKLAQWLTNEQNQLKRFEVRGFGPTNKVVAASTAVLNDPVISVVMEQAQFNRAQKGVPGNYWTPMGALITPFIAEKEAGTLLDVTDATLQEYLDALVAQITGAAQA
ncbi:MAG: extracellular solute-binding protein [Clostridia bacterium]|nr:extracellular solute-binding protein [Clostridia bacterium]